MLSHLISSHLTSCQNRNRPCERGVYTACDTQWPGPYTTARGWGCFSDRNTGEGRTPLLSRRLRYKSVIYGTIDKRRSLPVPLGQQVLQARRVGLLKAHVEHGSDEVSMKFLKRNEKERTKRQPANQPQHQKLKHGRNHHPQEHIELRHRAAYAYLSPPNEALLQTHGAASHMGHASTGHAGYAAHNHSRICYAYKPSQPENTTVGYDNMRWDTIRYDTMRYDQRAGVVREARPINRPRVLARHHPLSVLTVLTFCLSAPHRT